MSTKIILGRWLALALPFFAFVLSGCDRNLDYNSVSTHQPAFGQIARSDQTDVDRAQHLVDENGVPYLKIAGLGRQRHPAWIALYALAYAGEEVYDPKLAGIKDDRKFAHAVAWLEKNLVQDPSGLWVWEYGFDSTYNDISIKAPWSSAFAQATGIQAFLAAYRRTGDAKYLDLAKKAVKPLFTPLREGGFLFESGGDIWFEEIPKPIENPGHILNGHMRVLLALRELADVTGEVVIANWLKRGADTLFRWLPRYDAGYWLRYDLNPRKQELLFRLANPYGYASHPLAVDRITLRDPTTKEEVAIDVGGEEDSTGANRIAGTHWGPSEEIAKRTIRRLVPIALENKLNEFSSPHSYFYFRLPGVWASNLRDKWYELILDYYDDAGENIAIQQRTISPGQMFRDVRDGDLHLTGEQQWRRWVVPIRPTDLGYWVGEVYAKKHFGYLNSIAHWDNRFHEWALLANTYLNSAKSDLDGYESASRKTGDHPKQTPMLPVYSFDSLGVIRQHAPDSGSRLNDRHMHDPRYGEGVPVYSPFIVATQLIDGENFGGAIENGAPYSKVSKFRVRRRPALDWLLDENNFARVGAAALYLYPFDNAYNDVLTKAPWASAFGQAYVIKALSFASTSGLVSGGLIDEAITAAAAAYRVPVEKGGIFYLDKGGAKWYEEVPNSTHVLNAHLVSVPELYQASALLKNEDIWLSAELGVQAVREKLHLFDAGYWLRYDQNPKKELLFQIDWIEGEVSPKIDEVLIESPQAQEYVRLDIGLNGDFEGATRISGSEWQSAEMIDGRTVRSFANGYYLREKSLLGGARHNAFLVLQIPGQHFCDYFDVPSYRVRVRYKDVAKGRLAFKLQAIHDGEQLSFVPLRDGVWRLEGDGKWKERIFTVRPQDLGWYKGADYQQFEVDQLQRIAEATDDWFIKQQAERHRYFLEMQRDGKPVIRESLPQEAMQPIVLRVVDSSGTYAGYGYENALDGDAFDDYVAGLEGVAENFVVLELEQPSPIKTLKIVWESEENRANVVRAYKVGSALDGRELLGESLGLNARELNIPIQQSGDVHRLLLEFSDFVGQKRALLRAIEVR